MHLYLSNSLPTSSSPTLSSLPLLSSLQINSSSSFLSFAELLRCFPLLSFPLRCFPLLSFPFHSFPLLSSPSLIIFLSPSQPPQKNSFLFSTLITNYTNAPLHSHERPSKEMSRWLLAVYKLNSLPSEGSKNRQFAKAVSNIRWNRHR